MKTTLRKNQQGAVLLVGLFLLLVMTLIGVSSMTGANMQEKLAGNTNKKVNAQMTAEGGLATAAQWLTANWANRANWTTQSGLPQTDSPTSANFGSDTAYTISMPGAANAVAGTPFTITSNGYVVKDGKVLSNHSVSFKYTYPASPQACGTGVGKGIQAKNDINFNGFGATAKLRSDVYSKEGNIGFAGGGSDAKGELASGKERTDRPITGGPVDSNGDPRSGSEVTTSYQQDRNVPSAQAVVEAALDNANGSTPSGDSDYTFNGTVTRLSDCSFAGITAKATGSGCVTSGNKTTCNTYDFGGKTLYCASNMALWHLAGS